MSDRRNEEHPTTMGQRQSGQGQESFSSPPEVFSFAKQVLESLGISEWVRHEGGYVEFCREGDEGSSTTVVLQDSPYLEWSSVLLTVSRASCVDLDEFINRAEEMLG